MFIDSFIGNIRNYGLKKGVLNYLGSLHRTIASRYFPRYARWVVSHIKGNCGSCNDCCKYSRIKCIYLLNGKCSVYNKRESLNKLHCYYFPFPLELKSGIPKLKNCKLRY